MMLDSVWLEEQLNLGIREGCFPAAAAAAGVRNHVLAQAFAGEAPEPGGRPSRGFVLTAARRS